MNPQEVHERFVSCGVVPVVVADSADQGVRIADALSAGGVDVTEITFRSNAAEDAIRAIRQAGTKTLLGAGTVRTVDQAKAALGAGAEFIVTPGLGRSVLEYCLNQGVPVFPGVNSTMAIEVAEAYGLTTLKFFPAEASGGIPMLKALRGPYFDIEFVPTGGVHAENLMDYLSLPNVISVGGSWLTPKEALLAGDYDRITVLSREARDLVNHVP